MSQRREVLWSLGPWRASVIGPSLAATILLLLATSAITLLARRLSGALAEPLGAPSLLAIGSILAACAIGLRSQTALETTAERSVALLLWLVPSLLVVLLAAAISLRGTSAVGLAMLWGVVLIEEVWSWRRALNLISAISDFKSQSSDSASPAETEATDFEPGYPPDGVVQQLVRAHDEQGRDTLSGFARASFAPRERTVSVHVAFCPPFASLPELEAETTDGPPASVKVAQVLPYGARLEVRLDRESEAATSVLIAFEAQLDL